MCIIPSCNNITIALYYNQVKKQSKTKARKTT
uniref:Uncharacterized protein n=1 Tax=Siphoviridae sp. ct7EW56 TaxID=2827562 RepID=A0A8S5LRR0_9CAUD|nr:MAG TPA: hypothetical protein [Siphoviridae sp. ct7EW56]